MKVQSRELISKRLIGKGPSSIVYETTWDGASCARKDFLEVPSDIFEKEAAVLVGLDGHPHVVRTYCWTVDEESCSLVIELMDDDLVNLMQRKAARRKKLDSGSGRSGASQTISHVINLQKFIDDRKKASVATNSSESVAPLLVYIPFNMTEALHVIVQIAEGMVFLHDRGVVHGDLKPKNVLVTPSGSGSLNPNLAFDLKVADFGLIWTKMKSRTLVSRQAHNVEMVRWRAPELWDLSFFIEDDDVSSMNLDWDSDSRDGAAGERDVGVRLKEFTYDSDVFSFAITCWQILTGEDPYSGSDLTDLVEEIPLGLRPGLPTTWPAQLRDLIESCWGEKSGRPSFERILSDLKVLQASLTGAGPLPNTESTSIDVEPDSLVDIKRKALAEPPLERAEALPESVVDSCESSGNPGGSSSLVVVADPLFTPALVGAAVSSFFTEVINAAQSAYGHDKKCKLLLESVDKLQPHIDAACPYSANWEKAQTDVLVEIKIILDRARSFATKGAAESKSEWQTRGMAFLRWEKLPAELMDILRRIEEVKLNVMFSASIETLTYVNAQKKTELLGFVPQQIQSVCIVGVDIPFNRLKASILKASHDQDTPIHLGLHGLGGAGKTLLAQMLHNDKDIIEAYGSASAVIWITVGLDARVADFYKTMATFLQDGGFKKHYGHRSLEEQRNYLWKALATKKVFLILDDVWQESCTDNHEMMYWLNIATAPGSATLITTRNSEVLFTVYAESEVVLCLSKDDSWTLFSSHAFHNGICPPTVSEDLAKEVCMECKGLPLALKVVGSAMVDKVEAGEWNLALRNLKHSKPILGSTVNNELFGCLQWSYDKLESDVLKTCYLYFAAFPEDYKIPITKLFNMWISEGLVDGEDEAWAHLKVLEKRSLIHWNHVERCAQVQGILRDLVLLIIDKAKLGECGYDCFFQSGKVLKAFSAQKSLETIRRMSFINTAISEELNNLQAPQLQVCLLSGIVGLDGQSPKYFSNFDMINLKYLDLSQNHFNNLKLVQLKCLTHLDLSGCRSLQQLPETMGALKCLVHLDLSGCGSLWHLPKSMSKLKCLLHLNLFGCGSLKQLPQSMGGLKCLAHLNLCGCGSLQQLPQSMGELKCLVHLDLSGCESLQQLPKSMGELKCLVHLKLSGCGSLQQLPQSMGELKCLVHLDLSGCESLQQLPKSMGELKCLVHLNLSRCGSLQQLPESMSELKCLVHLDLSGCESLQQLPESMGELKCLVHLDLSGCESLQQLPESMGELKCLVHLDLSGCESLQQLPESMGELKCLVHLDLSGCESLQQLPESMGELKCLVHLDLSGCESLQQLPESMSELKCLVHLDLSGCESLQQLPESMGELKCLVHLNLSRCGSLQQLPESMGELKCLVHLDLSGCESLQQLPESMGELKCLVHLDLSGCESLQQLPESMGELKCLVHLNLSRCGSLQQLPESMGELKCLMYLNLSRCGSLQQLPKNMGRLKCLVH